jgi:hypothetical protein
MRLAIMGASVSTQALHHDTGEVTGYAEVLRRSFMERLGLTQIVQIVYPGNRISDGGLVRALDVAAPEVCLFEPLVEDYSRGALPTEAEIRFIYHTLLSAGVVPVTLFLPDPEKRAPHFWPTAAPIRALCQALDLPVIELEIPAEMDLGPNFSGVHTRLPGATFYATRIVEEIEAMGGLAAIRARVAAAPVPADLHHVALPFDSNAALTDLTVHLGAAQRGPVRVKLVQLQKVGLFSPVLDIVLDERATGRIRTSQASVWDVFCHYERDAYVVLFDDEVTMAGGATLSVSCSATDPDHASCHRAVAHWPEATLRHMRPAGPLHLFATAPVSAGVRDIRNRLAA